MSWIFIKTTLPYIHHLRSFAVFQSKPLWLLLPFQLILFGFPKVSFCFVVIVRQFVSHIWAWCFFCINWSFFFSSINSFWYNNAGCHVYIEIAFAHKPSNTTLKVTARSFNLNKMVKMHTKHRTYPGNSNGTRTHSHLVFKLPLNHLAKLARQFVQFDQMV